MRRQLALAAALVLAAAWPTVAFAAPRNPNPAVKRTARPPRPALVIRRIRVARRDIFDTRIQAENKGLFRAVNLLHVSTKESAIRGQLLLKEGDRYDADLAKESERAIRSILRLRNVRVTPIPVGRGKVDLLVTTQETWTTEPVISVSGVGDNLNLKAGLRERNLLGYGKNASYFYRKTDGIISRSFSYDDPLFLGYPLVLGSDYQDREDGAIRALSLSKPFRSSLTPWSLSASFLDDKHEEKELDNLGVELDKLRIENRGIGTAIGLSAGSTTRRVRRPTLGWRREESKVTRVSSGRVQKDALYHVFVAAYDWQRVNFLTVSHIDQYDRDEDFPLGPTTRLEAGFARRKWVRTSDNANFFSGQLQAGRRYGRSHFATGSLDGNGKVERGRWRSSTARADVKYYNHFQPRQTLAAHVGWAAVVNPGPEDQLLLGGDTGLRGYKLNQFAGNKLLLGNVENRFFVVDDMARFMSLGAVVFADAGYVWGPGRDMRLKDVKVDVGTGLRLYLNRTSLGHVLRFDLAYALKRMGEQKRLVFTFGSSHAF